MGQKIFLKKNKEIRLLVDAHIFDDMHQGTRTFLKGIYSNLDTHKYSIKIYLVANNIESLKIEFKDIENIEFIKLKFKNKYIRLIYEIPRIISKSKIDFAHFNYYLPLIFNKKCKYIVTIHDVLFLDFPSYFSKMYYLKNKLFFKYAVRRAEIVTTVSNYSAQRIQEHFNILNKDIIVLSNAINKEFSKDYKKQFAIEFIKNNYNTQNFLLYVSRLEPRKNHLMLLKIYDELELWKEGIELVFIGKHALENKELDRYFEEIKMKSSEKVHLFEFVDEKDLILFYQSSLISIFPSLCEGFGIPPLESAALRVPTICSNLTAMKEFSFFEEFHINPKNENELKEAILEMLDKIKNCSLEKNLHQISQLIVKKYSWKNTAEILGQTIKTYRD